MEATYAMIETANWQAAELMNSIQVNAWYAAGCKPYKGQAKIERIEAYLWAKVHGKTR